MAIEESPLDAWTVFSEMVDGNNRFNMEAMLHSFSGRKRVQEVAGKQNPMACVLACADSRVSPEVIFDQGLGDLFVLRVAGNFADKNNQASIEYALQHFYPPPSLIVVLGHERCGAIQAAAISFDEESVLKADVDKFHSHHPASEKLVSLVKRLRPAIDSTKAKKRLISEKDYADRLIRASKQNVILNVKALQANSVIKNSNAFVIGCFYDLDDGTITWVTKKPTPTLEKPIPKKPPLAKKTPKRTSKKD